MPPIPIAIYTVSGVLEPGTGDLDAANPMIIIAGVGEPHRFVVDGKGFNSGAALRVPLEKLNEEAVGAPPLVPAPTAPFSAVQVAIDEVVRVFNKVPFIIVESTQ